MVPWSDTRGPEEGGIREPGVVHWNPPPEQLCERAVRRGEGTVAHLGPLAVRTGRQTDPAAGDRYVVRDLESRAVLWWGDVTRPITRQRSDRLLRRLYAYFEQRELFVQDGFAGADPRYRLAVRVVTETAWHSLFARHLLLRAGASGTGFEPQLTLLHAPGLYAESGAGSPAFVVLDLDRGLVLIGGTGRAGELRRSIFTVMSSLLIRRRVLALRCAANHGSSSRDDVALFFGSSGSGKTALSADPDRTLIGDDAHGWSADGVFTFEGGCYTRVLPSAAEAEPELHGATRRFGTILENVMLHPVSRRLELTDASLGDSARASYPIAHVPWAAPDGMGGHPRHLFLLAADPCGVLPAIARLSTGQAKYHFLSGYTPGPGPGPAAGFDTCFGPPFMPLHPTVYADLLGLEIERHGVACWFVNTGWAGGPRGLGERIGIGTTRALLRAALDGTLAGAPTRREQVFGLDVPLSCPGVSPGTLDPRGSWQDPEDYDAAARELAGRFRETFQQFEERAGAEVKAAGPRQDVS